MPNHNNKAKTGLLPVNLQKVFGTGVRESFSF